MYMSGYQEGLAVDRDRPSWRSDAPRPLAWAAWYPAGEDAVAAERLIGDSGEEPFSMGAVAGDAEISRARDMWPVVLLSHGTGGTAQLFGWLGVRMASQGFVCIGANHHGNTEIEPYLPEGFLCWWERARDLTVLLDHMDRAGQLAGRLDLGNVFAAGFSLGAYTVLSLAGAVTELSRFEAWLDSQGIDGGGPREFPDLADHLPLLQASSERFRESLARHSASYRDPRVKAIMAYAPAPPVRAFEPASVAGIEIPVRVMVGQADKEAPHEPYALWLKEQNPDFDVELLGANVGHYVFLAEPTDLGRALGSISCRDDAGVDRRAIHDRGAAAAEALFRASLSAAG